MDSVQTPQPVVSTGDRPQRTRRRQLLGGGAVSALSGAAVIACRPIRPGQRGQAGAPADATPGTPSRGPQAIEVLTRAGVENPTGHSQFYRQRAQTVFTPETNIAVNLVDASPSVGENLTVLAAGGTAGKTILIQ